MAIFQLLSEFQGVVPRGWCCTSRNITLLEKEKAEVKSQKIFKTRFSGSKKFFKINFRFWYANVKLYGEFSFLLFLLMVFFLIFSFARTSKTESFASFY